jgi:hypothetical protein
MRGEADSILGDTALANAPPPVFFEKGAGFALISLALDKIEGMERREAPKNHALRSVRVLLAKDAAPRGAPPRQACEVWAYLRRLPAPGRASGG